MGSQIMSEQLRRVLLDIGWTPNRRVDISSWRSRLEADGFVSIPKAEAIMESFGNLTLSLVRRDNTIYQSPVTFFDAVIPGGRSDVDRVEDWQERLGLGLNPIAD